MRFVKFLYLYDKLSEKISTHILTVLTTDVILVIEQDKEGTV